MDKIKNTNRRRAVSARLIKAWNDMRGATMSLGEYAIMESLFTRELERIENEQATTERDPNNNGYEL